MVLPGFYEASGTSTRNRPHEPTTSKPVVPGCSSIVGGGTGRFQTRLVRVAASNPSQASRTPDAGARCCHETGSRSRRGARSGMATFDVVVVGAGPGGE